MIYLCYPSKIVGGAEHLMLKTAILLAENGFEVCIVDRKNGWLSHNIPTNIDVKVITIGLKKILLSEHDTLLVPASFFYKVDDYFCSSNANVILWVIQINNLIMQVPTSLQKSILLNRILQKYINTRINQHISNIQKAIENNAIIVMDESSERGVFQSYNIKVGKYLPVFVDMLGVEYNMNYSCLDINTRTVNALWIGRIDNGFKIHILCKLITDLAEFQLKTLKYITLNIIGDGEGMERLRKHISQYSNISINLLGTLDYQDLDKYIQTSHVGFAMGTSALDIASHSIPTVLLDFSYDPIKDCRYRWIFESENYSLGREIKRLTEVEINQMHTMDDLLLMLFQKNGEISKRSYEYVNNHHSSKNINNLLKNYINRSTLKINDLYQNRCSKPFWVYLSSLYIRLSKFL